MRLLAALGVGGFVLLGWAACSSTSTNTTGGGGTAGDAAVGGGGTGATGGSAGVGGSAGAPSDASTDVPIEQIAAKVAKALCDNVKACYGAGVDIVTQGADCETTYSALFEDAFVAAIKKSVSDGTITYDAKLAADCVAELEQATFSDAGLKCLDVSKATETCKAALGKLHAVGAPCAHSFECASGSYCDASAGCPGKCKEFLATGATCTLKTPCKDGMTCFVPLDLDAGLPAAGTQQTGTCQPYLKANDACEFGTTASCEPGTVCLGGKCRAATGLFTVTEGLDCGGANGSLCQAGLACELPPFLVTAGKCVQVGSKSSCHLALPDMCGTNSYCPAGYFNAVAATCTALPKAGESCAAAAAQAYSLARPCGTDVKSGIDLICAQGKCQLPKRIDDPCKFNDECLSGYCKPKDADAAIVDAGDAGVDGACAPLSC